MNITTNSHSDITKSYSEYTNTNSNCFEINQQITLSSAIIGLLLLISEILPYIKPMDSCNGIIHSVQCLIKRCTNKEHTCKK